MKGKVKAVRVVPMAIGKHQYGNIEALVENAYKVARREIATGAQFQVYTYLNFASQSGGNDFEVRTTKYTNASAKNMLVEVVGRAVELLQSDHEVLLKDFRITFNFIEIPSGSGHYATASRDRLSILNNKSVNRVVNDDNNCFWYALVMLVYHNHAQIKNIKMGRNIRTTLAMELCSHCGLEWNRPVGFDDIQTVEEKLQCNILVLDIEQMPILSTTSNIYNSLMYKNSSTRTGHSLKPNTQYWLLHDNNHYHSINNIKAFLAVDYFCPHCLQGFTNKKAFDNHKCEQCEDGGCSKRKKKQVTNSKIGKDIAHYLNRQDMKGGKDEIESKIEQLKRILEKANEDVNSEENKMYLEKNGSCLQKRQNIQLI